MEVTSDGLIPTQRTSNADSVSMSWPHHTPCTMKLLGGYIVFTPSVHLSVCPSIRPTSRVCSVVPTVLVGSISYLYILSSNFRRCVMCKDSCQILGFQFLAIFKISWLWLCVVLTWDLMWITSKGNHGAERGISECRCFVDKTNTARCCYNAVQYVMIFYTVLQWLIHSIHQICIHRRHPISWQHRQAMGCLLWFFF